MASRSSQAETHSAETAPEDNGNEDNPASDSDAANESTAVLSSDTVDVADLFSDQDLEQTADTSQAKEITVADGQDITITEEGVYVISGTAENVTRRTQKYSWC